MLSDRFLLPKKNIFLRGAAMTIDQFPEIQTSCRGALYEANLRRILAEIIPEELCTRISSEEESIRQKQDQFSSLLPVIKCCPNPDDSSLLSFYSLYRHRQNAFKFFFDLIIGWLVPGTRLNVVMMYAVDFRIPMLSSDQLSICEL